MANRYTDQQGLSKDQIENTMRVTLSNMSAARYLGVGYATWKKYASLYYDETGTKTLFEKHKNHGGIGVPKNLKNKPKDSALMDILEGKISPTSFTPERLKKALIKEQLIEEKCECCGFAEKRALDYKVPVLLTFRDGNKRNWKRDNLQLLCHNCFYLQIGDIYSKRQMEAIEGTLRTKQSSIQEELEIEDVHYDLIKDLINNTTNVNPDKSGEDLIFHL